jgi:hypothetical protein
MSVAFTLMVLQTSPSLGSSYPVVGSSCKTVGAKVQSPKQIFTCIRIGKLQIWSNPVSIKKIQLTQPLNIPITIPSASPAPVIVTSPPLYPVIKMTLPDITNLQAAFSGSSIIAKYFFDTTLPGSSNFYGYKLSIFDGLTWWDIPNSLVPSQSANQEWSISSTDQKNWTLNLPAQYLVKTGIPSVMAIKQIKIQAIDADFLSTNFFVTPVTGVYTSDLPAPSISVSGNGNVSTMSTPVGPTAPIITVQASTDSYSISVANYSAFAADPNFASIQVEEFVSSITVPSSVPIQSGLPWVVVNQSAKMPIIGIFAPDDAHRWVRVRIQYVTGSFSSYSNLADVTPLKF